MEKQRPDFIYPQGSMLMHSPLVLNKADMYGFFLKGKQENLQRSIDKTLNQVAGSAMYFKVLSPYVLTTFTQIEKAYSAYPEDRAKGWIKKRTSSLGSWSGAKIAATVNKSAKCIFSHYTFG